MMCQEGTATGQHPGEDREAVTVVVFLPSYGQSPACEDCARYWMQLRPTQVQLSPLSEYVDHFEMAMMQLQAYERAKEDLRSAPAAPTATMVSSVTEDNAVRLQRIQDRRRTRLACFLIALALGTAFLVFGSIQAASPTTTAPGGSDTAVGGIIVFLIGLIVVAGAGVIALYHAYMSAAEKHVISRLTPEKQERARQTARLIFVTGAMAAADIGLRAASHHSAESAARRRRYMEESQASWSADQGMPPG